MQHYTPTGTHTQPSADAKLLSNNGVAMRDSLFNNDDQSLENSISYVPDMMPGELSGEFAMLDPALAELHKDMVIAAAELAHAKRSGKMIDMSLWRFESAEGMYQTRLFEVRKNKLINDAKTGDESSAKCQLHKLTMQQRMDENFARLRQERIKAKKRKEEKASGGLFFYLILGMWLAQMNARTLDKTFESTRLQSAFLNARQAS